MPTPTHHLPTRDLPTQAVHPAAEPDTAPAPTLDHLLVEAAIECPEADALVGDFGSLSYADLLIRAQNIAVTLKRQGVGAGHFVGVALAQSPATIAAIAGIILAGAAYVPLTHPLLHAAALRNVRANGISVVLFDGSYTFLNRNLAETWKPLGTLLDVSRMEQETMPSSTEMKIDPVQPDATAALLLNTDHGADAGVRVTHRRIARLCGVNGPLMPGPGEMFLLPASRSGLFELWCSLLHGAALALAPERELAPQEFAEWTRRLGVSVLCLPVARLHEYIDHAPEAFSRSRHLIIESDGRSGAISTQHVELLQKRHPNLNILHTYTTAKIAGYATAYAVPARYKAQSALPIGRALDGLNVSILDRASQPVRAGEIGELAFSGEDVCDETLCLTGERARRRVDGLLELHGHAEPQLVLHAKSRGFGAEELQPILAGQNKTREAVVLQDFFEKPNADQDEGEQETSQTEMQDLEASPTHASPAIPSESHYLEDFPNTAHESVDRVALQPWKKDNEHAASTDRSHEKVLEQVRSLWLRLLRRNTVGYEEDFFEAGGTQVQMIRMHAELNRKFPGSITMGQLSVLTTIRKIYEHVVSTAADSNSNHLIQRGA